jgi:hypothetical protein
MLKASFPSRDELIGPSSKGPCPALGWGRTRNPQGQGCAKSFMNGTGIYPASFAALTDPIP